jgi:HK97 family phage major capsid protein
MTTPRHEAEVLIAEIRASTAALQARDRDFRERMQALEGTVNDLFKRLDRPRGSGEGLDGIDERQSAIGLLTHKHQLVNTKRDSAAPEVVNFSAEQVNEAQLAIRGLRNLMHSTSIDQVPLDQRKALSSFSFGSAGFILAPEMSSQVLSCLALPTDITSYMNNITVSGPAIKFLVDNEVWDAAAWACESSCFANSPTTQLGSGLGEMEIKPESLRYIACATRDLLEDAAINIEQWMLGKASRAFGAQISEAVMTGDGNGKPLGILHPTAGIPIMETAPSTPAEQFTWQDLVMLRWEVPISLQAGNAGAYLMNQRTWALCSTMSDANGRPIMTANASEGAPFLLGGTPVIIASQMPDVAPGATPVAFGNWKEAYTIVNRKSVTMMPDPYSAGFCVLEKFEARVGGSPTCANAARLLRIR